MSKKEIVIVVVILLAIAGLAVGGFAVWNHYHVWKVSSDRVQIENATPASDDISLSPKSESATTDSSGNSLKVDASQAANNLGQLGGTKTNTSSTSGNSASSSSSQAPGPETFAQYDQYKDGKNALFGDIQVGSGAEATPNKKVAIYYKGYLTNGTVFDQTKTIDSGAMQPFMFTVGAHEVILGMEQDIIGMKVGGSRRMIIPPAVGYGDKAQNGIPANSVLIFDVQLVSVQ